MRRTGSQMVSSSTSEPFEIEDLKIHLRLEIGYTDEDEYIMGLGRAAVSVVEDYTNRKIGRQTWKVTYDGWSTGSYMHIPFGPLSSMPSSGITYKLSTGNSTQFASTQWSYSTQETQPWIYLEDGQSWPSESLNPIDPVAFEVKVGSTVLRPRIKQAVFMMVGHWYENREPYIVGQTISNVPDAIDRLLYDYRLWDFG